jgi:integrase
MIRAGKEAGRWGWEVELVRKDGSRFRKAGTRKTEQEALKARNAAYNKFNQSGGKAGKQYTVESWCEYCLDGGMTTQTKKTLYHYRGWLNSRVYPAIGTIKLDELRVDTLQLFYQGLQDKDVQSAAVRVRAALNACLTRAVEEGHIDKHVGRIAKLKKIEARMNPETADSEPELPGKRILNSEEQESLLDHARDRGLFWPVFLGLKFGLRLGECLGLSWANVDLDNNLLKIRWQAQRIPGEGKQLTKLKTDNSRRDIPIPPSLQPIFKEAKEKATATGQTMVCPTLANTLATPQEFSVKFKSLCKAAKINGEEGQIDCTHHDLRSTFLTYMANTVGVSPATLRALAGHGKIETTFRYYIQAAKSDIVEAMTHV